MKRTALAAIVLALLPFPGSADDDTSGTGFDRAIRRNHTSLFRDGRHIFRYDTFGDEVFWGDALKLHLALAGPSNGGVGSGVSPRMALSVGLKVDVAALPPWFWCFCSAAVASSGAGADVDALVLSTPTPGNRQERLADDRGVHLRPTT
jgi:hypothetical protein